MSEAVNGITSFITDVTGTATSFIRESVVVIEAADKTQIDLLETAGATRAAEQTVDFDGTVVGGNATGLAADATTYTAVISIDGTDYNISVVGSASQTFTNLLTEINADITVGTEAAISGGNIVVTSTTNGNASKVTITDTDLMVSLTGYAGILTAVDGGLQGEMQLATADNGSNLWEKYKGSVEIFDTTSDKVIVSTDFSAADLNAVFSDVEVEAEVASLGVKVNALQNLVK